MARPKSLYTEKTTFGLESDVRKYSGWRDKVEARTFKWQIKNSVHKGTLADAALRAQPQLFSGKV